MLQLLMQKQSTLIKEKIVLTFNIGHLMFRY